MLCAIPLKPSGSRSPKPRDASEQIPSRCAGDEQDDAYCLPRDYDVCVQRWNLLVAGVRCDFWFHLPSTSFRRSREK